MDLARERPLKSTAYLEALYAETGIPVSSLCLSMKATYGPRAVTLRKPIRVTATLNWQLHQRLQERADFEGRSLSNLVCHLLELGAG